MNWAEASVGRDEKHVSVDIWGLLFYKFDGNIDVYK